jgi:hypothetical protein
VHRGPKKVKLGELGLGEARERAPEHADAWVLLREESAVRGVLADVLFSESIF